MASRLDGRFELSIYLQNSNPDEPIYVLEPTLRILVQIDRSWQPVPVTPVEGSANTVHAITSKQVFPLTFRADFDRCDELIKGYMHMRISNVMFISENPEPIGNLFERNDDYYITSSRRSSRKTRSAGATAGRRGLSCRAGSPCRRIDGVRTSASGLLGPRQ